MIRSSVRLVGRLALSAALSWSLIPIASAEGPAPDQSQTESGGPGGFSTPDDGRFNLLNTIPEDGMGDTAWLSGATRIVRELTAKRPNEDLVICIGGCFDMPDRVVYAQATEITPKPATAATATDIAPVSVTPAAAGAAKKALTGPDAGKAVKAADPALEKLPAISAAAKATAANVNKQPAFVPTMAEPKPALKPAVMPAAAAPAK